MFLLRNVKESDLDDVFELSQLQVFINLPAKKEKLRKIIINSIESFKGASEKLEDNYFVFALEDLEKKKVIGVSMIHGKHGTKEEPHFYLKVSREHKFSTTINTGFIHGTLKLGIEDNGYSEIGGLVLNPEYRGHAQKLGKQLSFVRFLYIAQNPELFTKTIHCELMPPFDENGKSPLWEAIGRQFMNMNYDDADRLSRENKEFILSLFPSDTIYETLLPLKARNAIGKVGKETQPVKKMLESIGFEYIGEVDPFDGGPHYRCSKNNIKPVKEFATAKVANHVGNEPVKNILFTPANKSELFEAFIGKGSKNGDQFLLDDLSSYKKLNDGDEIQYIFTDY